MTEPDFSSWEPQDPVDNSLTPDEQWRQTRAKKEIDSDTGEEIFILG